MREELFTHFLEPLLKTFVGTMPGDVEETVIPARFAYSSRHHVTLFASRQERTYIDNRDMRVIGKGIHASIFHIGAGNNALGTTLAWNVAALPTHSTEVARFHLPINSLRTMSAPAARAFSFSFAT